MTSSREVAFFVGQDGDLKTDFLTEKVLISSLKREKPPCSGGFFVSINIDRFVSGVRNRCQYNYRKHCFLICSDYKRCFIRAEVIWLL